MNQPIVRATVADIPALADVLATCFRDDPMLTWPLFVDDDDIEPIRLMFVWLDTELAEEGWIWTTEDRSAVMALIPPDAHERMWELDRSTRPKIGALCPDGGARYTAFWERVVSRFPDEPHWFVDQLAVHPERQGECNGSLLGGLVSRSGAVG